MISAMKAGRKENKMKRKIAIGDHVKFVDPHGVTRDALVKQCWGNKEYDENNGPAINVVFISGDENKNDGGGRQTEYETSVPHKSHSAGCPGRYWYQD